MSRSGEIWLLGGYGDVGLKTARRLRDLQDRPIVLAGRNAKKAEDAAKQLGGGVRGAAFNVTDPSAHRTISDAAAVVNLVESTPHTLAAAVVEAGGVFLDTSASPAYLKRLEAHLSGHSASGLAVLSVGLSPGLTNIMAAKLKTEHPEIEAIDLCLEMGLGRHHGLAATSWFLENAGGRYPCISGGSILEARPGQLRRRFNLGGEPRGILALGYGFSDQLTIGERLELRASRSFVALDPPWMTRILSLLLRLGLGGAISRNADMLAGMMLKGPAFGKVRTRAVAEALDRSGTVRGRIELTSCDQAEITALMAAATALSALDSSRHGIVHSDSIMAFDDAAGLLAAHLPETTISLT
jgi:hypothetical protein